MYVEGLLKCCSDFFTRLARIVGLSWTAQRPPIKCSRGSAVEFYTTIFTVWFQKDRDDVFKCFDYKPDNFNCFTQCSIFCLSLLELSQVLALDKDSHAKLFTKLSNLGLYCDVPYCVIYVYYASILECSMRTVKRQLHWASHVSCSVKCSVRKDFANTTIRRHSISIRPSIHGTEGVCQRCVCVLGDIIWGGHLSRRGRFSDLH